MKRKIIGKIIKVWVIVQVAWNIRSTTTSASEFPVTAAIVRSSQMSENSLKIVSSSFSKNSNRSQEQDLSENISNSNHKVGKKGNQDSMQRPVRTQTKDQLNLYGPQHFIVDVDPSVRREAEKKEEELIEPPKPRRGFRIVKIRTLSGKTKLRIRRPKIQQEQDSKKPRSKTFQQMLDEYKKREADEATKQDSSADQENYPWFRKIINVLSRLLPSVKR